MSYNGQHFDGAWFLGLCFLGICGVCASAACGAKEPLVTPVKEEPPPCIAWEYKTLYSLPLKATSRNLDGGGEEATSVTPNDTELTKEGMEGWELAGSYLETETGYLETDKQILPNIRPQRLVMIFKRPYCPK